MSILRLNPDYSMVVAETVTLATSVRVAAGTTSASYAIPAKSGYVVGAVTPMVSGAGWGNFSASVANGMASVYFRNGSTAAYTVNLYARVLYVK